MTPHSNNEEPFKIFKRDASPSAYCVKMKSTSKPDEVKHQLPLTESNSNCLQEWKRAREIGLDCVSL